MVKGVCLFLLAFSLVVASLAAPAQQPPQRQKRVSDQRLAELETLLALAQMKNRKYMSLPVGFGLIDVQQIGRKKRSAISPLSQFLYTREFNEIPLKSAGVNVKMGEIPLKNGGSLPFASPVIVDAFQGWERKPEPNLAFVQDGENYI